MVRRIGLWLSDVEPNLPDPRDMVDLNWDADERDDVASYLSSGVISRAYMGYSTCRICGFAKNGSLEFTDGVFQWPEGLKHYVSEHSVRLPAEIVEHVVRRLGEAESAPVDEGWWRQVTKM